MRMRAFRGLTLATLALATLPLATLTLAGCSATTDGPNTGDPNGVEAAPAADILSTAVVNARAQTSVRLQGAGACPDGNFQVDLRLGADEQATGTITLGSDKLNVVSTPTELYVQGPVSFWTALSDNTRAARVGSHWVRLARTTSPCLATVTSYAQVLDNYLGYPGAPTKQPSTVVQGTPAVLLQLPDEVSFWVTTTGTALPARITDPAAGTALSLLEWSNPVAVTIPAATDVVEEAVLRQK